MQTRFRNSQHTKIFSTEKSSDNDVVTPTSQTTPNEEVFTKPIPVAKSVEKELSAFELIGVQMKELRSGLEEFQAETYEQLYGKDLKWSLEDGDVAELTQPSASISKPTADSIEPAPVPPPVVNKPVEVAPVEAKSAPKIAPAPVTDVFLSPKEGLTATAGTVASPVDKSKV